MGGGLMQLVAYGAQDVYLTGNAQITFFKVVYRRHTNFSQETMEHPFNGAVDFGRRASVEILRNGDLATDMYLRVVLPRVANSGTSLENRFAWVRRVGYAMIKNVELDIGGSKIDKQYGDWMNIWFELTHPAGKERGHAEMVGDTDDLTRLESHNPDDADKTIKRQTELFIPLYFWFNRNNGLALPLIALQYHEVRVHFEFNPVSVLYVCTGAFVSSAPSLSMVTASLLVNYIFLDSQERRRFAQVGHEYLIEQLQFTGEESAQSTSHKYKLNFNHPTKELVFAAKNGDFITGQKFLAYNPQNWTTALNEAAENLVLGMLNLNSSAAVPLLIQSSVSVSGYTSLTASEGAIETTSNGITFNITGLTSSGIVAVRFDALKEKTFNLSERIERVSFAVSDGTDGYTEGQVINLSVTHRLTMRDLSRALARWEEDNRNAWVKANRDVRVYQHTNYGVCLDGSKNPVSEALLQLNGHDRFDKQSGKYFGYVQPERHHSRTPADGINVYSFALKPEQHQPSGSANLSRIDQTQLNVWFADSSSTGNSTLDGFTWDFLVDNTQVLIFAHSYNVLRIMSGMGGLAYSN
jgi:hypothetical protein